MSQYYINTGNVANNGLGDPLRTAFNDTNLNFTQIFTAGPVGSNIQIANNTILTTNTNGNLILATNGTGAIVPAASIVPDLANVRMIGSGTNRFNTVYTQYLDATSGTIAGNLFVNGSLLVSGNTVSVDYSTLNIANSVITVSAGAPYPALADGSGIVVGGAGATFLYGAVDNAWVSNLPVMAPQFIGDGSMLSNVQSVIDGANMQGNTINATVLYSNLVQVGTLTNLSVSGNLSVGQNILSNTITSGEITAISYSGNAAGLSSISGANITGTVGNATYATFAGAAETANVAALATQAVNADLALAALSANTANSAQYADIANWANCANTAYTAYVANAAVVAGYANTVGILPALTVTGNVIAGWLYGDGSNISNISGTANTGNITFSNTTISTADTLSNVVIETYDTANSTTNSWTFGSDRELYLPTGGRLGVAGKGWTGLDGGNGAPVSLTSFYANGFYAGCVTNNTDGNINLSTYTGNGLQGNWTFDNGANLVLAPTNLGTGGAGSGEAAKLRGTRRIVGGYTNSYAFSTVLAAGGTPTVAYTATDSSVQSVRVTFAVQGSSSGWEQFDVVAVQTLPQGNVNFTVSNRVKANDTPDTVVTATWNGTAIEIALTLDASQTGGGWASFDAVEFGLMAG